MTLPYNRRLKQNSRALRSNMTDAEQKLWYRLRRKQVNNWQFYRQKPLGQYIVDFYCPAASLVVELDGSQHLEPQNQVADQQRDAYLVGLGLRVLRFDNRQVLLEMEAVVGVIAGIPPSPPFAKGGVSHLGHEACAAATELPVSFPPLKKEPWPPNSPPLKKEPWPPNFPPLKKGGQGGFELVQRQTLIEARERLARRGVLLEGGEDE